MMYIIYIFGSKTTNYTIKLTQILWIENPYIEFLLTSRPLKIR
jgi:hypothetical protein